MLFDNLTDVVTTINRAKAVGRQARKSNASRKTEEQLMRDNGYTLDQAKAYLEAYDATIPDNQEKLQKNHAKAMGRQARKHNYARKTEEQLMSDNSYTQAQAKAYLEAFDAAIPANEEKKKLFKARDAGRRARKRIAPRKSEDRLMSDNGYTLEQARAYLQAYDAAVDADEEQAQISKAKAAGRIARKHDRPPKTEEQLISDKGYTLEQAMAYLKAYFSFAPDKQEKMQTNQAKNAGRIARKSNCARKTEEQLMSDNSYSQAQAKAYLDAYDAAIPDNHEKLMAKQAKDAGRQAGKNNYVRKTEEQLMNINAYTQEQAKAYLAAYDAAVATKAEQAQIKDDNPLKRKGKNSAECLAKRHAKNVSAQGESESPLSTNTASSQCEPRPENSINILMDAIFEQEKTQHMCPYYSAVSRRDSESSVDEPGVNAVDGKAPAKVRQKP